MSTATTDDVPIGVGAGAGAAAWVGGVVVTFIVGQLGISTALSLVVGLAPLQGTMSAYTSLHTWFLSGSGGGLFAMLTLIPILVLVGAGYYVASQNRSDNGFATGASVAVGYLAMTVVGIVLLFALSSGGVDVVDRLLTVVIGGVVFPLLFGGIGGLLADRA